MFAKKIGALALTLCMSLVLGACRNEADTFPVIRDASNTSQPSESETTAGTKPNTDGIKTLKVAGTITTDHQHAAGIAAYSYGDCTIQSCWSNVAITSTVNGDGTHGGLVAVQEDGSLGEIAARYTFEGKEEGRVSTIHQCLWDQTREYLFACAQGRVNGYGQMRALKFDSETGVFTQTDRFLSRTWDEPRHAAVHPNKRWLYMVEEKGNKVLYFSYDPENGTFKGLQELSTVPETVLGYSDASEIVIDPSGEYVLVSNRYTDSIAVYHIDQHTGYLRMTGFSGCLGKTPRFFCFGPNGRCYVANEDSDTIVEFTWDPGTGTLKPTLNIVHTGSPVCITFLTRD